MTVVQVHHNQKNVKIMMWANDLQSGLNFQSNHFILAEAYPNGLSGWLDWINEG